MAAVLDCSICGEETKYSCLRCSIPVCNRSLDCSIPAEEYLQKEFESVSYCKDCQKYVGGQRSTSPSVASDPDSEWNVPDSIEESLNEDESDVDDELLNTVSTRSKRKRGKRSQWADEDLDDFVDIILNDENHKRKLIFQNTMSKANKGNYESIQKELKQRASVRGTVFNKTIQQMRNKFKKLVSECKKANMVYKTATGISNYKDQKGHSKWFDILFPLVKSRDSCQPEQALEPSVGPTIEDKESEDTGVNFAHDESDTSKNSDDKLFVPKPPKKMKKTENKLVEKTTQVLEGIQSILHNQQTSSFLEFMEKENARARAHELEVMKLLIPSTPPSHLQGQYMNYPANYNTFHSSSEIPVQQVRQAQVPVSKPDQLTVPFQHTNSDGTHQQNTRPYLNQVGASITSNYPHTSIWNAYSPQSDGSTNPSGSLDYFKL